jgi:hypothetical protein
MILSRTKETQFKENASLLNIGHRRSFDGWVGEWVLSATDQQHPEAPSVLRQDSMSQDGPETRKNTESLLSPTDGQ